MKSKIKSKEKKNIFNENSTIKEILNSKRGLEVLIKYKVPCLDCPLAFFEIEKLKLRDLAIAYGIDIKKVLKELNSVERDSK